MLERQAYTYILASQKNGTLYIGVISDLVKMDSATTRGMTNPKNITLHNKPQPPSRFAPWPPTSVRARNKPQTAPRALWC